MNLKKIWRHLSRYDASNMAIGYPVLLKLPLTRENEVRMMPTCQNCHKKWTWKQTMTLTFANNMGMICPYCGNKQYITATSKKWSSYYGFIIPIVIPIQIFLNVPILPMIIIFLSITACVIGGYPSIIKLSNKPEING